MKPIIFQMIVEYMDLKPGVADQIHQAIASMNQPDPQAQAMQKAEAEAMIANLFAQANKANAEAASKGADVNYRQAQGAQAESSAMLNYMKALETQQQVQIQAAQFRNAAAMGQTLSNGAM